jgi:hypothetical protein
MSAFFYNKARRTKETIASRLLDQVHNPFVFDVKHCRPKLDGYTAVTIDEVVKLLNKISAKLSALDFVPTSAYFNITQE